MTTDNTSLKLEKEVPGAEDFLPILGTDFVELYVGNAKQAAYYYQHAWGFQPVAYSGLETGRKDRVSYVLQQGKIRLVLTSPLQPNGEINEHIDKHGDGVKAVALWVDDARKSYKETTSRGAKSYVEPYVLEDEYGSVVISGIHTYGETIHLFVERSNYTGAFMPGYKTYAPLANSTETGLKYIDHMVGNVGWNEMNKWCEFYAKVMGFAQMVSFDDKDISTEYTALMSKVMSNGNGRIKFPINEPAEGKKKSQIEEYIDFYNGAGVQHIALATDNIIDTVTKLRNRGVEFLNVPETYYDDVLDRVGEIDEELEPLKKLGVLIDRDDEGYLLQIFTKPVLDRPTMFFEIIQRKGAQSFGKGNFKALFEAIEREQDLRGTLN
ncbi:4-hydroxyphenylpyruvate dioxygenase [Autumnicola musiva]|uniref:4-hydroxyphenylpyruvate dioxygenase n=1 Tax=Autumnicola musiva TaxID=3075589 RepID=A0ABU3D103_9FLAO|nr:4-hydroxyphenylpyruvate dioxygenase [Zunongwangia sp. F117]MDT0675236.1 4-hydroxyphenylpyruvate dioxygenase [Zunongwangia sp. F117]